MSEESDPSAATRRIKAEVIDHFISLHMGENHYKVFRKGEIVDIEPVTFRNLERKGRVVRAGLAESADSADVPDISAGMMEIARAGCREKKRKKNTKTAPPAGDDAVPC